MKVNPTRNSFFIFYVFISLLFIFSGRDGNMFPAWNLHRCVSNKTQLDFLTSFLLSHYPQGSIDEVRAHKYGNKVIICFYSPQVKRPFVLVLH